MKKKPLVLIMLFVASASASAQDSAYYRRWADSVSITYNMNALDNKIARLSEALATPVKLPKPSKSGYYESIVAEGTVTKKEWLSEMQTLRKEQKIELKNLKAQRESQIAELKKYSQ